MLTQTKGDFAMRTRMFVGEGANRLVKPGLPADSVSATINQHTFFKATKPEFKLESTKLNFTGQHRSRAAGVVEFKSAPQKTKSAAMAKGSHRLKTTFAQVYRQSQTSFMGGFSLTGSKVGSQSLNGGSSTLTLRSDSTNSKRFVVQGKNFEFTDSLILARDARMVIYPWL